MFQSIVLAVDGSEHSMLALAKARTLAETFGAKLILVHAYPRTSDLRGFSEYNELLAHRKNDGMKILEAARRELGKPSCDVEEDLLEGPASQAILTVAETRKADLIVMGTRGMGSVKGVLFGSVSSKVSHYAPCSVLVVR